MRILISLTTLAALSAACSSSSRAADIRVKKVLLTLIDDIEVPAKEAGVLGGVAVKIGTLVKKGDNLAKLDDRKPQLALNRYKIESEIAKEQAGNDAEVRFAKKAKQVAEAELQRAEDSNRRFPGSISDSQIDALRLAVAKADAEIDIKSRELSVAKMNHRLKQTLVKIADNDVNRRRINSPINGMVIEVKRKPGEWVEPGEKVFRIVRLDKLRVRGFIKAADSKPKLVGKSVRVTVTLAGGGTETVYGKLVFVNPLIDPNNRDVSVIAEIPNRSGRLQPGLQGSMTIVTGGN